MDVWREVAQWAVGGLVAGLGALVRLWLSCRDHGVKIAALEARVAALEDDDTSHRLELHLAREHAEAPPPAPPRRRESLPR